VIPVALVRAGLPVVEHWKIYLPVIVGSFVIGMPLLFYAERRGRMKLVFMGAVALLLAVELALAAGYANLHVVVPLLLAFFVAFNILEASLPSLVSRVAPVAERGTALGVYNTTQALGLAAGGLAGGWIANHFGGAEVFVFGTAVVALWLFVAARMRVPGEVVVKTFALARTRDPLALRERLTGLHGVRDVDIDAGAGMVRLRVYPDSFDERAIKELIEGDY
jgi:MFS family permease